MTMRTVLPPRARPKPLALLVRSAVVVPALAAAVVTPHLPGPLIAITALAVVGAVVQPGLIGTSTLLAVQLAAWGYDYGVSTDVPAWRTIVFAVALYSAHTLGALAAAVPWAAWVDPRVVSRWALRAVPGIASAVVAGVVVDLVGRPGGSRALDVVGLAAATSVVGVIAWLVRSTR